MSRTYDDDFDGTTGLKSDLTAPADTTPPRIVYFEPSDHLTEVNPKADIVLGFNELIEAGQGTITISDGDGDTRFIDIGDQTQVQFTTQHTAIEINLADDLKPHTVYHITVSPGAVTDASGNAFAGLANGAYDFKTQSVLTSSDAVIKGTSDLDIITGTATGHPQTIYGYAGNDIIHLGSGGGFIDGGAGHDTLYGGDSANGFITNTLTDAGDNDNVLHGGNATGHGTVQNFLSAEIGHNQIYGGNADGAGATVFNYISGGTGLNVLWGGGATNGGTVQNFITDSDIGTAAIPGAATGGSAFGPNSSVYNQITLTRDYETAGIFEAGNGGHAFNFITSHGNHAIMQGGAGFGAGTTVVNQIIADGLNNHFIDGSASSGAHVENIFTGSANGDLFEIRGSSTPHSEINTLTGGAGGDTFVFDIGFGNGTGGRDSSTTITDFKTGTDGTQDILNLTLETGRILTRDQILSLATEHNGSTTIHHDSGLGFAQDITLEHVTKSMLAGSDFLLV